MNSYITAIGTATPELSLDQMQIADFMISAVDMSREEAVRLKALYKASGIKKRHTVITDYGKGKGSFTFFPNTDNLEPFPTVKDRMLLYEREALPLSLKAIRDCLLRSESVSTLEITHLITVSCTGMYAPGLDIDIINALGLPHNIQRTCINFMGCYAAFNGLKTADYICRANPQAKVLLVCTELCSIHFQKRNDWDTILSNALFSDGSAAVIIQGKPAEKINLSINSFYCEIEPKGKTDMAWNISNFGFEMVLSSYVPDLIRGGIRKLSKKLLKMAAPENQSIDLFAIHPGGKRILEVIESELGFGKQENRFAYKVLREFGNMSSATVLFVLNEMLKELSSSDQNKNILSFAFGPGLTLESMLLSVATNQSFVSQNSSTKSLMNV